jgi:hypothetical protein
MIIFWHTSPSLHPYPGSHAAFTPYHNRDRPSQVFGGQRKGSERVTEGRSLFRGNKHYRYGRTSVVEPFVVRSVGTGVKYALSACDKRCSKRQTDPVGTSTVRWINKNVRNSTFPSWVGSERNIFIRPLTPQRPPLLHNDHRSYPRLVHQHFCHFCSKEDIFQNNNMKFISTSLMVAAILAAATTAAPVEKLVPRLTIWPAYGRRLVLHAHLLGHGWFRHGWYHPGSC